MSNPLEQLPGGTKALIDGASIAAAGGAMLQLLPHIAAGLSIIWTLLRLWESPTVQGWITRLKKCFGAAS